MSASDETASAMVAKAAPPAAVAFANSFSHMTLPDIVQWFTLLYLCLMISHKSWRMYKEWKTGKEVKDE